MAVTLWWHTAISQIIRKPIFFYWILGLGNIWVIWEIELDLLRGIASVHLANEAAFFRLLNPANLNNLTKTIQSKAVAPSLLVLVTPVAALHPTVLTLSLPVKLKPSKVLPMRFASVSPQTIPVSAHLYPGWLLIETLPSLSDMDLITALWPQKQDIWISLELLWTRSSPESPRTNIWWLSMANNPRDCCWPELVSWPRTINDCYWESCRIRLVDGRRGLTPSRSSLRVTQFPLICLNINEKLLVGFSACPTELSFTLIWVIQILPK